jgi:hypothetical protein
VTLASNILNREAIGTCCNQAWLLKNSELGPTCNRAGDVAEWFFAFSRRREPFGLEVD